MASIRRYLYINLTIFIVLITQSSCLSKKFINKKIIIASAGKIESVDPAQASTLKSLQLISGLGDRLYLIDINGFIKPQLAADYPIFSEDSLSIDIPLREDVFFHDGSKFDAEAMIFSMRRFLEIGILNYQFNEKVKSLEAPEKYLLRINLKKKSSSIIKLLTSVNLTPVSPKSYKNYQGKFLNEKFIGTGPYKLVKFTPEKQSLDINNKYWGIKPKNDGIEYVNYRNTSTLFGALKNGNIDILLSNSIEDIHRLHLNKLAKNNKIKETIGPETEIGFITLRSDRYPFNNKNVRKAISYLINRDLIVEKVSFNQRESIRSITPRFLNNNGDQKFYWPKYNIKIAENLLKKEGYCLGNKLNVNLTFRSNVPADKLMALIWKQQIERDLSKCISLTLNNVESTTVYKQLSEGSFAAVILDWTGSYPDPEAYLSPLLSCSETVKDICKKGEAVLSGSFWSSKEIQNYLKKSEAALGEKRSIIFSKIEELTADNNPYIPLWIVRPKVWTKLNISNSKFDLSGFLKLDQLIKLED